MNTSSVEVAMSLVQNLREFINERLTAAAEEIFTDFKKTIVEYEEEDDRQRRLLELIHTIPLHTTDLPLQHVHEENVLAEQNVCNQERNSSLDQEDPELPQMKEEQEELCTSHEGEHLVLMQEADMLVQCKFKYLPLQHVHEENAPAEENLCNQERNSSLDQEDPELPQMKEEQEELCTSHEGEQLVLMQEADMLVQCKSKCEEISREIFQVFKKKLSQFDEKIARQRRLLDIIWKPQILLHRIDIPQQHVCKEEKGVTDLQLCNQERNFHQDQEDKEPSKIKEEPEKLCTSLDQNDQEPPQIKEEQQELCISQQGEQVVLRQETFRLTSTDEISDHSELEPNNDQVLSYNSSVADRHKGERRYCCEICGKRFNTSSQLTVHIRIHTGEKPYCCKRCDKRFATSGQVTLHMRTHTGVKPYSCKTCGKKFAQRNGLLSHMRTHSSDKPYICQTYGKRFIESNDLTGRKRRKTCKNFFCEICGKSFSQNLNLTAHMRTHTGEKPFVCETCGKRFAQGGSLTVHRRTHTGEKPYSCEVCGKNFRFTGGLTVHMRTHTGEKPYCCETCGKNFARHDGLVYHLRTHT